MDARVIAHRYRLRERLGAGRAQVWAAEDALDGGRLVALKLVALDPAAGDRALANLWREYELLRGLAEVEAGFIAARDIGVATTGDDDLDTAVDGAFAWLAVDLIDGETLATVLRAAERPALADVMVALRAVLRGVATLHACNLTHGDIKPTNVMVPRANDVDGYAFASATLIDLELAAQAVAAPAPLIASDRESGDGGGEDDDDAFVDGTLAYLAPERLDGSPPTSRADVYAFGAMACYALTGRLPVAATDEITTRTAHRAESGHRLSATTPDGEGIPDALRTLLSRCVATDPMDRPVDAGAALEQWTALDALTDDEDGDVVDPAAAGDRVVLPLPMSPLIGYGESVAELATWLAERDGEARAIAIVAPPGAGKRRVVDEAVRQAVAGRTPPVGLQLVRVGEATRAREFTQRHGDSSIAIAIEWPTTAMRAEMKRAETAAYDELLDQAADGARVIVLASDAADLDSLGAIRSVTLPELADEDVVALAMRTLGLKDAELPHAYRRWLLELSPRTPGRIRDGLANLLSPPKSADASGAFLYRAEGRWQFAAELDPAAVRLEPTPWVMPPVEALTLEQAGALLEQAKTISDAREAPDELDASLALIAEWLEARRKTKATRAAIEALRVKARHLRGRLAMRRSEWATAETFIGPTVEAYRERVDGASDDDDTARAREDLAGVLLDYASVAEGQGHSDAIMARLVESESHIAELTGQPRDRLTARANELRARIAWTHGDYASALAGVEVGVHASEALGDARGIAIAHANRGLMLHLLNREDEADAAFAEAERRYRQLGLRIELSIALNSRSALQLAQGRFAAMRRSLREALRLSLGRDRLSEVVARCNLAAELMIAGEMRDAQRTLAPVPEVAGQTDDALVRAIVVETGGEWSWRCGDVDAAVQAWSEAAGIFAGADLAIHAARVRYRRALALALIGRVTPARAVIASVTDRERDEVAGASSDTATAAVMWRELAMAMCEFGDGAWALAAARVDALLRRDAEPALSQADLREALPIAVRIWIAMGRYADALRDLVRAQSMPGLVADDGPRATLDLLGAELAWYRCDPARALTLFHSARNTIQTLRARAGDAADALAPWATHEATVAQLLRVP